VSPGDRLLNANSYTFGPFGVADVLLSV